MIINFIKIPNLIYEYNIKIYASNQIGNSNFINNTFITPKLLPFWDTDSNPDVNLTDTKNIVINWNNPNNGGRLLSHVKKAQDL